MPIYSQKWHENIIVYPKYDIYWDTINHNQFLADCYLYLSFKDTENEKIIDSLLDKLGGKQCNINIKGDFRKIPPNFYKIRSIKTLRIQSSFPICIESQFSEFNELETMLIIGKIQHIDTAVRLERIKKVDFSHAYFLTFPIAICYWKTLEVLTMYEGKISRIPHEIQLLQNLEILGLGNQRIKIIPHELYSLQKLRKLYINDNKIQQLDDDFYYSFKNLNELDMDGNRITVSSLICHWGNLDTFIVRVNKNGKSRSKLKISEKTQICLRDKIVTMFFPKHKETIF
jgi:Leucine-rich repeat (LRR) protein